MFYHWIQCSKTAISNGWIKLVTLAGNRTNITLSSTASFKCDHYNDCNIHHKPRQSGV